MNKLDQVLVGYKMTEVGIIPDDWEIRSLGDILAYEQPSKYIVKSADYHEQGNTPVLTAGKSFLLGYTNETIGIFTSIPVIIFDDFTTDSKFVDFSFKVKSSAIKILKPKDMKANNIKFIFEAMNQISFKPNDHKRYWISEYQYLEICVPPTPTEQQAIAKVLTNMDNYIQSMEKLLEKKQNLKQGFLQNIFNQNQNQKKKIRFKKEDGSDYPDWEEKELGDVTTCLDTLRIPLNEQERSQIKGTIPYCGANGVVDYINKYTIDDSIILLAEDGGHFEEYQTKPIAYQIKGKCWVNNHAHIIKANHNYDQQFIFYSLEHKDIRSFLSGGTRVKLNKSEMLKIKIKIPTLEEQEKIANFLTAQDTQIASLKQKIEKAKLLKQGAMQELLTGKTRLKCHN